ncbi:MAG: carboxylating nicotinate-nucleotide diphosphorylase [Bacteroidales bacterium]|nr:carboxylating nicotinate-nucleotide diphosphorylase [Bacteroidales bacterium]MCF8389952.1 carboxylating nicotinate-nucleotide diphosphorylase [Bacteroidales bacterium]
MNQYFDQLISQSIDIWFAEDIGEGDHTTLSTIPENVRGKAGLLAKDEGVIAGIEIAQKVMKKFDPSLKSTIFIPDGSRIKNGDIVLEIEGSARSILQTERLILNLVQRLSGVATQTRVYADALSGLKTKVLDTRKTTPGLRILEKEAVRLGGGMNHRIGLFDMILIKDNHIDFAGGIEMAVRQCKSYLKERNKNLKIEVEARSLTDVEKILAEGGVFRIMLDNFTTQQTREAVKLINGRVQTESSGGITLETIRSYAECGVDFISVGALTHQIKSLDLSLKAVW